jgi:AcrR family transcriptional regulator
MRGKTAYAATMPPPMSPLTQPPIAPARRTQAERSASTRARLVAAATDALHRLGYAAASTNLVADLAGVSRGAMLHQFPSKALLMAAVVQASFEADYRAYRQALRGIADPLEQLLVISDIAWVQFRSPSGIAQTEIWMATRSDPELAAAVLPVHDQMFARSFEEQARRFVAAGLRDMQAARMFLYHNVALLRGLSLEHVLGTPRDVLDASVERMKQTVRDVVLAARANGDGTDG